jgi:hypothetical protein
MPDKLLINQGTMVDAVKNFNPVNARASLPYYKI